LTPQAVPRPRRGRLATSRQQIELVGGEQRLAGGMNAQELATIRRWLAKIATELQQG
jgi:hypothetical protein